MPNWANRSVRRTSLGEGKAGSGSKFLTSAAIWQSYAPASKAVMRSTPHLPSRRFCQNDWISSPKGVTTPRPVTTTLRSSVLVVIKITGQLVLGSAGAAPRKWLGNLLLLTFLDIFDHVTDALELLGLFIGDFLAEFLFQGHDQLDCVEGIGTEIFDELRIRSDLVRVHAKLLHDDLFDLLFNRFISSHELLHFCIAVCLCDVPRPVKPEWHIFPAVSCELKFDENTRSPAPRNPT